MAASRSRQSEHAPPRPANETEAGCTVMRPQYYKTVNKTWGGTRGARPKLDGEMRGRAPGEMAVHKGMYHTYIHTRACRGLAGWLSHNTRLTAAGSHVNREVTRKGKNATGGKTAKDTGVGPQNRKAALGLIHCTPQGVLPSASSIEKRERAARGAAGNRKQVGAPLAPPPRCKEYRRGGC